MPFFPRLCRGVLTATLTVATAQSLAAQSGTIVFSGVTPNNNVAAVASYTGPLLSTTPVIRAGFGNTAIVPTTTPLAWWQSPDYSGQSMAYGNGSQGQVLELLIDAGAMPLTLTGATFGAWPNASRRVGYRFFSADFVNSSALFIATPGTSTPDIETFSQSFGSQIRLQYTELDVNNALGGRGPVDVGIQNITYRVGNTTVVPEPSTYALLLAGGVGLFVVARRRRAT